MTGMMMLKSTTTKQKISKIETCGLCRSNIKKRDVFVAKCGQLEFAACKKCMSYYNGGEDVEE